MFANEESVLQYFYEHGEVLNIYQLEEKFDNSPREEILEIVTALEKKNYVKYLDSALWAITDIGDMYYKSRINLLNVTKPPTKAQKIITAILIGLFVTVAGGLLLLWFTKYF
jgi:hypothetical protein